MTISAKVIAASARQGCPPIVTMELRYPRFIHAEFMTHRVFSRNASSSRAVPVKKMIQDVIDDPAMPVRWGANQPGMQDAGDHDALVPVWTDYAFEFSNGDAVWDVPENSLAHGTRSGRRSGKSLR